jgi:two-component system nitrogen regulation response regulator NtrX
VPYKRLLETVERALRQKAKPVVLPESMDTLGSGEPIRLLVQKLKHAAASGGPILLTAEPGAGAEECAHYLHTPKTPWVAVNDVNILADRCLDLLAEAKGGLLFIPEVGRLTPYQQRGLQLLLAHHAEYGVRIVCASSVNLAEKASQGSYSRDLYNALARVAVRVPALREHGQDIPQLAQQILVQAVEKHRLSPMSFSDEAIQILAGHAWPGNLDELRNVVTSLAVAASGDVIDAAEVQVILGLPSTPTSLAMGVRLDLPLKEARDEFERTYLTALLEQCDWGVSKAAGKAGMERTAFYRKLKTLGIELPARNE